MLRRIFLRVLRLLLKVLHLSDCLQIPDNCLFHMFLLLDRRMRFFRLQAFSDALDAVVSRGYSGCKSGRTSADYCNIIYHYLSSSFSFSFTYASIIYLGRRLTSLYNLPIYSPISPTDKSCTPPINHIETISDAQPAPV